MPSSMSTAATTSGLSRNQIVAWVEALPRLEPMRSESTISTLELPRPACPPGAALRRRASSVSSTEGIRARNSIDVAFERGVRKAAAARGVPLESTREALACVAAFGAFLDGASTATANSSAYQLRRCNAVAPSSKRAARPAAASRPARGQSLGRRAISKVLGLIGGKKADNTSGTVGGRPIKVLFETGHRCTTEDYLSDFKLVVWTDNE